MSSSIQLPTRPIHWYSDDFIGKLVLRHFLNQYSAEFQSVTINSRQNGSGTDAVVLTNENVRVRVEAKLSRFNERRTDSTRSAPRGQLQQWWNFNHLDRATKDSDVLVFFGIKTRDETTIDFSTAECLEHLDVFIIPSTEKLPKDGIKPRIAPSEPGKWDKFRSDARASKSRSPNKLVRKSILKQTTTTKK